MATPMSWDLLRKEIKAILKRVDLHETTSKSVRLELEKKFSTDLSDKKHEISQLCKQLVDAMSSSSEEEDMMPAPSRVNADGDGTSSEEEEEANDSVGELGRAGLSSGTNRPPSTDAGARRRNNSADSSTKSSASKKSSKKSSTSSSSEDNESETEEMKNGRRSRGRPPVKKKAKVVAKKPTKSVSHVESSDDSSDSDSDNSDNSSDKEEDDRELNDEELARKLQEQERPIRRAARNMLANPQTQIGRYRKDPKQKKERKQGGKGSGYTKPCTLSKELAELLGSSEMARHMVVQKMHQIIKDRNLQDPKNKQYHICDEQLMQIFGRRRVKTFGMMKYLKKHIVDAT